MLLPFLTPYPGYLRYKQKLWLQQPPRSTAIQPPPFPFCKPRTILHNAAQLPLNRSRGLFSGLTAFSSIRRRRMIYFQSLTLYPHTTPCCTATNFGVNSLLRRRSRCSENALLEQHHHHGHCLPALACSD